MMTALQRGFANLAMAKKLAMGFALVLLLTGVVAATGLSGLQAISLRFADLKQMAAINTAVLQARVQEQTFALSGAPLAAQSLRENLALIAQMSSQLQARSPAQSQAMGAIEPALAAYQASFEQFVELAQSKELALEQANWSVSNVANNLSLLQDGLSDDGAYELKDSQGQRGAEWLTQANQVSQISRLMLQAMNEAHVRLDNSRKGQHASGQIVQAAEALALVERLKAEVSDAGYRSILNEAGSHIANFTSKLAEYIDLLAREQQIYRQLREQAEQVVAQVDQAYVDQDAAMQAELKAKSQLILAAAGLALLAGALASWLITRIIVGPLQIGRAHV